MNNFDTANAAVIITPHWMTLVPWVLVASIVLAATCVLPRLRMSPSPQMMTFFIGVALGPLLLQVARLFNTRVAVFEKGMIVKTLMPRAMFIPVRDIKSLGVQQGRIGRTLDFGNLIVVTDNGNYSLTNIRHPREFAVLVAGAIEGHGLCIDLDNRN